MLSFITASTQNLDDLDSYSVDEIYKKLDLDYGSLDQYGNHIDFTFVKTDLDLSNGLYEVELTDGPNDLYEVKGTNIYLTFTGYYGYAGYADECILEVKGGYYNNITIYKID